MPKPQEICFGPFVATTKTVRVLKDFEASGVALEFTSTTHQISPLFRLASRDPGSGFSRGAGGFYVHQNDLPCEVISHGHFSKQADGFAVLPLDEVLLAIYRGYSAPRPLRTVLEELRGKLPAIEPSNKTRPNHLCPTAVSLGFRTITVFSYGRTMTVRVEWVPVEDLLRPSSCSVPLGYIEFKPQRDRTLGKGKWIKPRCDFLGMVLREELARVIKGPPIKLFSDDGVAALVAEYPWKAISLLDRKQLEDAKVQFVREHPELHNNLLALAKAMIKAGLYSEGTQHARIKKTAVKILAKICPTL